MSGEAQVVLIPASDSDEMLIAVFLEIRKSSKGGVARLSFDFPCPILFPLRISLLPSYIFAAKKPNWVKVSIRSTIVLDHDDAGIGHGFGNIAKPYARLDALVLQTRRINASRDDVIIRNIHHVAIPLRENPAHWRQYFFQVV